MGTNNFASLFYEYIEPRRNQKINFQVLDLLDVYDLNLVKNWLKPFWASLFLPIWLEFWMRI